MASQSTTDPFPGFENLFELQDPVANPPFRADILFDKPFRLLRAETSPTEPVRVAHAMGGRPQDFIWTTYGSVFLVSERVCKLLENARVSGWKTYPVEVIDRVGAIVPGFYGFAVTGRCGSIDPSMSHYYQKLAPVQHGKACWHRKGLYFEPRSWDGSEIFCPSGRGGYVFVVERVKQLIEKAKVRNVKLGRLSEDEALVLPSQIPAGRRPEN
jgi:hypothetical protein